jgi:hypothetical protein
VPDLADPLPPIYPSSGSHPKPHLSNFMPFHVLTSDVALSIIRGDSRVLFRTQKDTFPDE